jgi:hypothetical protein
MSIDEKKEHKKLQLHHIGKMTLLGWSTCRFVLSRDLMDMIACVNVGFDWSWDIPHDRRTLKASIVHTSLLSAKTLQYKLRNILLSFQLSVSQS